MKKFYLSFVGFVLGLTTAYADNVLSLQDVTIEEGTAEVVLPISLTNESSITGFQCDLSLPTGVIVATDEYGDCMIEVARTTASRHTISSSLQPDGSLRILCTSMTNATFSGNSGVVLNVTLAVSENMVAGTYNVSLKNIVLSDPDANRHTSPDATAKLKIESREVVDPVNTLSLQDITIEGGVTEAVLPISMANESSITGFQCDLSLPSGVTVAADEYGDYIIEVGRTTTKRHTISSSLQSDGSLRILCTSMTNATFSGNSGVVLNVTLAVSENMAGGTYNVGLKNIVLSDPDANRHAASDVTSVLTVVAVEKVTVTANNITMVYGDQVPKLTYKSDGAELKGTPTLSCSATSTSPVGTYPITVSKGSVENKNVSFVNGTLTIVKAPLKISAGNYTKKQGEENPKFTATYSGFKNGETSAVLTKQPTFTTDVTASTAPGQYAVKVSGAEAKNYEISYVNGTLTVTEADKVTITANNITMVYGDAVPELTYTSGGAALQGTPVLSCSATSKSPVGTYPITISKGSVENYNVSYVNGTLTIVKAPLTISAGNYTKKQGEENPKFTATYSGFKNGETSAVLTKQPTFATDVTASTAPGQYAVKVSGAEAKNYNINYVDGTLTVTEAGKVTVIANNITMVYGDAVPDLTYTCGDELVGVPVLSCSATSKSPVGTYPITISKGSVENYNVSYVNGTLTIVKAPLTISAGNYTKKQGEENPQFTATYSGFKNGETSAVLTKQPTFTTDVVASTVPGQYTLKVSGAEAQNYEIGYIDGSITVVEADKVIVTVDDVTIEYGDEIPALTYTSNGELIGTPELSCSATSQSPVGTYPITISEGSVESYNVDYVGGTLTIVRAPLIVSVGDYTRKEGEDNPVFEIIYTGFKNNETEEVMKKLPVVFTTATKESPAGVYDILIAGGEADNYSLGYEYGILTVEPGSEIVSIDADAHLVDVYSLTGLLVKKQAKVTELNDVLPKGVYIVNGRKVVIR